MAIVAIVCAVLAVGFGFAAYSASRVESTLAERGIVSTATIMQSNYASGGTSSIVVRFNDARGTSHDASIDVASSPPPVGTKVTVTYDPANTDTIRLSGADAAQNMGSGGWTGVAELFAIIAVIAFAVRILVKRLQRSRPVGGSPSTTA